MTAAPITFRPTEQNAKRLQQVLGAYNSAAFINAALEKFFTDHKSERDILEAARRHKVSEIAGRRRQAA